MLGTEFSTLRDILRIQRKTGISPTYYIPPILLSVVAVTFESIGMGLLVPLTNGFFTKDFSFMKDTPVLGSLVQTLPEWMTTRDQSLFIVLIAIFLVAILLKNIFRFLGATAMSYVAIRSMHHLRKLLFRRYLRFGKQYFDRSALGEDMTVFAYFAKFALRPLLVSDKYITAFFSVCGYMVVMSLISWQLTLAAMPLLIIIHTSIQSFIRVMRRLSNRIAENASLLGKKTTESISLAPYVQAFNMEDPEQRRFEKISEETAHLAFRMSRVQELIPVIQEITTLLAALALFTGMLYLLAKQGVGSSQSFIVYFYLVLNAAAKFGTASNFRSVLAEAKGNVAEVMRILSDDGKEAVPQGDREFSGLRHSIELRDVRFAYRDGNDVLRGMSAVFEQGKTTAIVGATGSGKSTIINLLLRHYDCPPGSIFLDGIDIRSFTNASIRKHMAIVSQDTFLFHESLRFNVTYGTGATADDQVWDALRRARLDDFVRSLPRGLDTLIGDRGVKLSGGEKQRLAIARALLRNAEILLLDEATSALDTQTEQLVQEAIDDAVKGRTAIVIAHRLSTVRNADRIIALSEGRKVEEGTLQELLDHKGTFSRLWEMQMFF